MDNHFTNILSRWCMHVRGLSEDGARFLVPDKIDPRIVQFLTTVLYHCYILFSFKLLLQPSLLLTKEGVASLCCCKDVIIDPCSATLLQHRENSEYPHLCTEISLSVQIFQWQAVAESCL